MIEALLHMLVHVHVPPDSCNALFIHIGRT
jgi:hypothetical protein